MKKLFPLLVIATIYFSCSASTKIITTHQHLDPEKEVTYEVGDTAQGGIIFLVNEDGTHGLVAAMKDQFENSSFNECAQMMNNPLHHNDVGSKYFDWRLPKLWEAYKMYLNLHLVNLGDFSNSPYWTSQGTATFDKMSLVNFSSGIEIISYKNDTYRARAVRSF